jgi:hypothetical protein
MVMMTMMIVLMALMVVLMALMVTQTISQRPKENIKRYPSR